MTNSKEKFSIYLSFIFPLFWGSFKESVLPEFILVVGFVIYLTFAPSIMVLYSSQHLDLQRQYGWRNTAPLILDPLLCEPAWCPLLCLWIIYFIACVSPRIPSISLCRVVSSHLWNCKYSWLNLASSQTHCGFSVNCRSSQFTDLMIFICMVLFTQNEMSVLLEERMIPKMYLNWVRKTDKRFFFLCVNLLICSNMHFLYFFLNLS